MKLHQTYLFKCGKNPHLPFLIDFSVLIDKMYKKEYTKSLSQNIAAFTFVT